MSFLASSQIESASPHSHPRPSHTTTTPRREAKRTLPRPKVGDFCSTAMEQGFSDVCISLCMDQRPVVRVAQTCRAAAVEMPRPTVRKWCEHGYNAAFFKTTEDLASHFKPDRGVPEVDTAAAAVPADVVAEEVPVSTEEQAIAEDAKAPEGGASEDPPTAEVVAKIPVTIGGNSLDLLLHEGESAEDAVVRFCKDHVKDDVSACIRQMLPEVLERLEESGSAGTGGLRGSL